MLPSKGIGWLNGLKNKTHLHAAYNRLTSDPKTYTQTASERVEKDNRHTLFDCVLLYNLRLLATLLSVNTINTIFYNSICSFCVSVSHFVILAIFKTFCYCLYYYIIFYVIIILMTTAMKLEDACFLEGKLWQVWTEDSILKSRDITLLTKVHIVKAMVFPVVMYGCESWTIRKTQCWSIDAFDLWCWRRLLGGPWTLRISNQSILKEMNPEYSLEGLMLKLKLQYFGHLCKVPDAEKDWGQEEKGATEDEMVGWHHRLSGREFEQTLGDREREAWCAAVHGVTKSQTYFVTEEQ